MVVLGCMSMCLRVAGTSVRSDLISLLCVVDVVACIDRSQGWTSAGVCVFFGVEESVSGCTIAG